MSSPTYRSATLGLTSDNYHKFIPIPPLFAAEIHGNKLANIYDMCSLWEVRLSQYKLEHNWVNWSPISGVCLRSGVIHEALSTSQNNVIHCNGVDGNLILSIHSVITFMQWVTLVDVRDDYFLDRVACAYTLRKSRKTDDITLMMDTVWIITGFTHVLFPCLNCYCCSNTDANLSTPSYLFRIMSYSRISVIQLPT